MTMSNGSAGAAAALRRELGAGLVAAEPVERYAIGGRAPEILLEPASAEEAGAVIAAAAPRDLAVAPLGGGTALGALLAPARPFVGLLTRRLSGVVAHAAADMTVTALSGTTLAELARVVRGAGQRLPLDVPEAARATVGGMIAVAMSGPLGLGHGTVRDHLLGIAVADAEGRLVRSGGRVVKNVAGYDLKKLHAGARGTLGAIVEATFKLKPLPDRFVWVVAAASAGAAASASAAETVRRGLAAAQVPAVALELMSASLAVAAGATMFADAGFVLAIGLEGVAAEIAWQEARAHAVLAGAGAGPQVVVADGVAHEFLRALTDFGAGEPEGLLVRGTALPSRLPELVAAWSARLPDAVVTVHAGNGVLRLLAPAGSPDLALALIGDAAACGGHAAVERPPRSWRDRDLARVVRSGRTAHPLAARLKAALDPASVFLPGAYLGLGVAPSLRAGTP